jgi:hypothetical protein
VQLDDEQALHQPLDVLDPEKLDNDIKACPIEPAHAVVEVVPHDAGFVVLRCELRLFALEPDARRDVQSGGQFPEIACFFSR